MSRPSPSGSSLSANAHVEPAADLLRRREIESAVEAGNGAKVVGLLRGPTGLAVLGGGFGGAMTETHRTSFAGYCIRHEHSGGLNALRAVIEAFGCDAPHSPWPRSSSTVGFGSIEAAVLQCKRFIGGRTIKGHSGVPTSLLEVAVSSGSLAAVRLALALGSSGARADDPPTLPGRNASAHLLCLDAALSKLAWHGELACEARRQICRELIATGLPISHDDASMSAMHVFVRAQDSLQCPGVLGDIFGDYLAAGLVSVTDRVTLQIQDRTCGGVARSFDPFLASVLRTNAAMAVALLKHGWDEPIRTIHGDRYEGGLPDFIRDTMRAIEEPENSGGRLCVSKPDGEWQIQEFAAAVTAAVIEREIKSVREASPPVTANVVRPARRSMAL